MSLRDKLLLLQKITVCVFVTAFVLVCWKKTYAGHGSLEGLSGPSFSDPSQVMEMPDGWREQPIRYEPSAGEPDLVVTLDQQMYPAFSPLIQQFAGEKDLDIVVHKGTCGLSAGMLSRKTVDIGGYCCAPGFTDRLPGLKFHTIGISSLALIVHPDNPVEDITIRQARGIFHGEIYRWSEVTTEKGTQGINTPVQPVARLHCKLRPGHWRFLLKDEDLFSPRITEVGAIPDMIYQVSSKKSAIGYETLWMIRHFHSKRGIKILKIDGYDPRDASQLIKGRYPLYRVYNLTTWEREGISNPLSRMLVEYILQQSETLEGTFRLIPASRLRKAGWRFSDDELIGEPE